MRIIETKVYKYSELSDDAKAKARDWWRKASAGDNFFAECVEEDFHEVLAALGFDVDKKRGLAWSGFWSQGDGASFSGSWRARDCDPAKLLADRPAVWPKESGGHACPQNAELHRIAAEILAVKAAGMEYASVRGADRWGFHMSLDSAEHEQERDHWSDDERVEYVAMCETSEERFIQAARELARMFYRNLEAEWEYQNSDEVVAETIEANEYEFTEEGARA